MEASMLERLIGVYESGCRFKKRGNGCREDEHRCHSDDHDRCPSFLSRVLMRSRTNLVGYDWCAAGK